MHTTDASTVPSTSLKSKLFDFGLGERLVSFGQNDDAAAVKQSLLSAFPKLEQAGGFEILKVREGTRTVLEVIQVGSFPAAKLRSFGSSASSKLYLRPLQNDIPLEEGSSEDFEYCTECGECFPVMELRQHKEECLKIDPMLLEAPYVCNTPDQQQQPNQEELPVQRQERLSSDVLTASIISIIESIQGEEGAKEVLASYCKGFLEGRRLDVDNDRQSRMDGDVEEIFIDRSDIFKSAFSELMRASVNRRLTLKVNMFGEQVDDLGGPRREVLTILHRHVGEHFFKDGTLVSNETFVSQRKFEFAGVICALCLLQGGPPPKFFRQDILKEVTLVGARGSAGDEMKQFINGLDLYGVVKLMDAKPEVRVFFNKDVDKVPPLTVPGLLHLFAPITYAPNGSNKREKQKASMQSFTKWLRAVDEGKRFFIKPGGARDQERPPMALGDVLRFITGCENIPLFGLMPTPTLIFMVRKPTAFFATVSTCINMLRLPIEENALILLTDEDWFKAFDISFSSEDFQKEIFD